MLGIYCIKVMGIRYLKIYQTKSKIDKKQHNKQSSAAVQQRHFRLSRIYFHYYQIARTIYLEVTFCRAVEYDTALPWWGKDFG